MNNKGYLEKKITLLDNISLLKRTFSNFRLSSHEIEPSVINKILGQHNAIVEQKGYPPVDNLEALQVSLSEIYGKIITQAERLEADNAFLKTQRKKQESQITELQEQLTKNFTIKSDEEVRQVDEIEPVKIPSDVYINSNILVSPGPRKDKDCDTELGEDASGVLNTPKGSFFWVLDGTSESPDILDTQQEYNHVPPDKKGSWGLPTIFPKNVDTEEQAQKITENKYNIFSSRILAQLLSNNIAKVLKEKDEQFGSSLSGVLEEAVRLSIVKVTERINNAKFSKDIIRKTIEQVKNNSAPYCSTTVLFGYLSKTGRLQYLNLGDSEVFSFSKEGEKFNFHGLTENNNPSRLFVYFKLEDESKLRIDANSYHEKIKIYEKKDVDLLVAFSDGLGQSKAPLGVSPERVLSVISFAEQLTFDDKSLVMLERNSISS